MIPVNPNTILQIHRDLCKHMSQNGIGGHWKRSENVVSELVEKCPDISETTIERTLKQFLDEGYIRKIGGGRGAAYAKL